MDGFMKPTVIELSDEEYDKFMEWLNSPSENKKVRDVMELVQSERKGTDNG